MAVHTTTGKVRRIASGFSNLLSLFWDGAQRLLIGGYGDDFLYALVAMTSTHIVVDRDFNGDGKSDILWRHTSGSLYEWLLNGTSDIGTGSPGGATTDWQSQ